MFGSNDDKKPQSEAGEKKGLFGWWRKKPQETAKPEAESAAPEAPQDALTAEADTTADAAIAPAEPTVEAQPRSQPEPVAEPAPAPEIGRASCREREEQGGARRGP